MALVLSGVQVAYETRFLRKKNPLLHDTSGYREVALLTNRSGATRVYEAADFTFVDWDRESKVVDGQGQEEASSGSPVILSLTSLRHRWSTLSVYPLAVSVPRKTRSKAA